MGRILRTIGSNIPLFPIVCVLIFAVINLQDRLFPSPIQLIVEGQELSPNEAAASEKELEQHPDDLDTRTKLMGYYEFKDSDRDQFHAAYRRHALWFIEHAPDSAHTAQVFYPLIFDEASDPESFARAEKLWLDHVNRAPENIALLENAAQFLMWSEPDNALGVLTSLQEHQPNNFQWHQRLGEIYYRKMYKDPSEVDVEAATTAFECYKSAEQLIRSSDHVSLLDKTAFHVFGAMDTVANAFDSAHEDYDIKITDHLLEPLALTAFEAGKLDQAAEYARVMLSAEPNAWFYNAFHHSGNIVLGRIALANGDVDEAKKRLINAATFPDVTDVYLEYPDVNLARELSDVGESEIALEYLEQLSTFSNEPKLNTWIADLKSGEATTLIYDADQALENVTRHYFNGRLVGSGPGKIRGS